MLEFVPEGYWPKLLKDLVLLARGKATDGTIGISTPKGDKIAEYSSSPVIVGDKVVGIQSMLIDITELRKMEEQSSESKEQLRNLYESIPDALAVYVGKEGHLTEYNKSFKKRYGYCDEELKDKTFLDFVHPNHHAMLIEEYRKHHSEEDLPFMCEIDGVTKKGESFPMEISAGPYKRNGRVIGINVMHRDITERRKAEKELADTLEKLKTVNEKLGVVGKLTRHDVRNKLTTARISLYMAEKKLSGNNDVLKHLSEIDTAIGLIGGIFDFAATYEKIGVEQLDYVDVEKSIGEAVALFSDLHSVSVKNDCHGLTVLADSLLRQVFYNLVHNSMTHGENVRYIKFYYETGDPELRLVYEDDGIGISKAEKEKIFKEGYGKGSGYGLYSIKKMCEVYGWTIQETGKRGKGAQFTMTIPKMSGDKKENYELH